MIWGVPRMSRFILALILALSFLFSISLILTTAWFWLATVTASCQSDFRLNRKVCWLARSNRFLVCLSYDSVNAIFTPCRYYLEFLSTSSVYFKNQPLYHELLLKNTNHNFSRVSFASHSKYFLERHVEGQSVLPFISSVSTITRVLHDEKPSLIWHLQPWKRNPINAHVSNVQHIKTIISNCKLTFNEMHFIDLNLWRGLSMAFIRLDTQRCVFVKFWRAE